MTTLRRFSRLRGNEKFSAFAVIVEEFVGNVVLT